VVSDWKKDSGEAGTWGFAGGLKTTEDARFYDISAAHEEFSNKGKRSSSNCPSNTDKTSTVVADM